jgi:hypothetical protein
MKILISIKITLLVFLFSLSAKASFAPFSDVASIRREFLEDHRVFEKIIEGKSEWESTFCHGVYSYRILVRTQLKDLDIQLGSDGSVILKAVLHEPYVGFQGSYQGAYSFCFPISKWSGVTAEDAKIEARVEFTDTEEGRVRVNIKVNSVELGRLMSDSLYNSWEESITHMVNNGLSQVWSSSLGEWFSLKISSIVNDHLPSLPKEK